MEKILKLLNELFEEVGNEYEKRAYLSRRFEDMVSYKLQGPKLLERGRFPENEDQKIMEILKALMPLVAESRKIVRGKDNEL